MAHGRRQYVVPPFQLFYFLSLSGSWHYDDTTAHNFDTASLASPLHKTTYIYWRHAVFFEVILCLLLLPFYDQVLPVIATFIAKRKDHRAEVSDVLSGIYVVNGRGPNH